MREKGVQFNPNSIRKGLLNLCDIPIYKITQQKDLSKEVGIAGGNKLQFP